LLGETSKTVVGFVQLILVSLLHRYEAHCVSKGLRIVASDDPAKRISIIGYVQNSKAFLIEDLTLSSTGLKLSK